MFRLDRFEQRAQQLPIPCLYSVKKLLYLRRHFRLVLSRQTKRNLAATTRELAHFFSDDFFGR